LKSEGLRTGARNVPGGFRLGFAALLACGTLDCSLASRCKDSGGLEEGNWSKLLTMRGRIYLDSAWPAIRLATHARLEGMKTGCWD